MDENHKMIIRMSHGYMQNKNATPQEILTFIEKMKQAFPDMVLDEKELFRQLESIHSVSIGSSDILDDKTDHVEWFNPSTGEGLKRKIDWHFWNHYKDYLTVTKGWPKSLIDSIDQFSSQIFSRLEDPERIGPWDRRGMVMGSIQSGKTANYTALITKAADAGYKLVIILAGVHNSLRSQTQTRLNEEFLGYDMDKVQRLTGGEKKIGVKTMFPDHRTVFTLTSSSEKGDFSRQVATQVGIFPDKNGAPIILVIKKNVSILRNLITWIQSVIGQTDGTGKKVIKDIPLLLIDDECDFASINTKEPERDEDDRIIEEWNPTTTNMLIRMFLNIFKKVAYVGYTATPYANVFIYNNDPHPLYGEDLFPRSFIISLPQPSNYMGPERVFGLDSDPDRDIEAIEPLPLVRIVNDQSDKIPEGHDKKLMVDELPNSLKRAMKCFLLSCAARRLRSEGVPHNSMLVHVTRFTDVQAQITRLITKELKGLVSKIMSKNDLSDFREIWEKDFIPTSTKMKELGFSDATVYEWRQIEESLGFVARVVRVKTINGTVKDVLDYKEAEISADNRKRIGEAVPWEDRGLSVIAVGGDKLSRGLTLEGLSVTYYLRASALYDTLMQMGRWFGYRGGYSDLCRIFTTDELIYWYRHIAMATQELREEVEYMSVLGRTPSEFGLKIRSHPGRLAVTSAGKSRSKQKISLSYDHQISQTIVFDPKHSQTNLRALEGLIRDIARKPDVLLKGTTGYHWRGVPAEIVLNFLAMYRTHDIAKIVDPERIAGYIEKQNSNNELVEWDVAIISKSSRSSQKSSEDHSVSIAGYDIRCVTRNANSPITSEKISIGTLVSPADEDLDLSEDERGKAREFDEKKPGKTEKMPGKNVSEKVRLSGGGIRHARPKERGLFLIYLLTGKDEHGNSYGKVGQEIIGWALSFPESETAEPIEYWVNPVYQNEDEHYI
jgi:hypothetical protein